MDLLGGMRGSKSRQDSMLALVTLNELVRARHPVRTVKKLADECLAQLSDAFDEMYSAGGRPIPPER
jgi:hypothetical protein